MKPKTKEQVIQGIAEFGDTVDKNKYLKYIERLKKVIPKFIDLEGTATGY